MRNIIKNLEKEQLQKLLTESSSLAEVISKLSLAICGAQYKNLSKRIKEDTLDISHFSNLRFTKKAIAIQMLPDEIIFCENSTVTRNCVKNRIKKEKIMPYECKKCSNNGTWQNEKLSLQLEHINGIRNDNRVENLCWLCPNCHSQTSTFAGKNIKMSRISIYKPRTKPSDINPNWRSDKASIQPTKITWPNIEEMKRLVWQKSLNSLSKILGVSDVSVARYCDKHHIDRPKMGYWLKNGGHDRI